MILKPLTNETKAAHGWTHEALITFADFAGTVGATNVATINLLSDVGLSGSIEKAAFELVTAFDASDATLISLTAVLQLASVAVIAAAEVCVDGTEVFHKRSTAVVTAAAAGDDLTVLFTGTAAKLLSTLNTGALIVYFRLNQPETMLR